MKTKLRQCPVCKEWFNTTTAMMSEHYNVNHEFIFRKTFAIAELTLKKTWHDVMAKNTEFPECMQHYVAARVAESQIFRVQCATDPAKDSAANAFMVGR